MCAKMLFAAIAAIGCACASAQDSEAGKGVSPSTAPERNVATCEIQVGSKSGQLLGKRDQVIGGAVLEVIRIEGTTAHVSFMLSPSSNADSFLRETRQGTLTCGRTADGKPTLEGRLFTQAGKGKGAPIEVFLDGRKWVAKYGTTVVGNASRNPNVTF